MAGLEAISMFNMYEIQTRTFHPDIVYRNIAPDNDYFFIKASLPTKHDDAILKTTSPSIPKSITL